MAAGYTTVQVGTYNFIADAFTSTLDLNDRVTYNVDSVEVQKIPRTAVAAFNVRNPGEVITKQQFKNRSIVVSLSIKAANVAGLDSALDALITAIEARLPDFVSYLKLGKATGANVRFTPIRYVEHDLPYSAKEYIANAQGGKKRYSITFHCSPLSFGARQTLSNLVSNPGFDAVMGGGIAQTPPQVFSDFFVTNTAYAVQAGGPLALGQSSNFPSTVMADSPLHYYRMNDLAGTAANDGTSNALNGTYTGGFTLNSTGLLTGDSDPAVVLNGTTGYVLLGNAVAAGMPTGNGAWSVEVLFSMPASPTVNRSLFWLGNNAAGAGFQCFVDINGKVNAAFIGAANLIGANALTSNATHRALVTWDGTTLSLYVDNSAVVTSTPGAANLAYGSGGVSIGANYISGAASQFWNGTIDEVTFYTSTLSSARASAHWTAATTAPTTLTQTMLLPTGTRVAFGSPSWRAINTWQLRFQFMPPANVNYYLHYTDANNYLAVAVYQTGINLLHVVGGVGHSQQINTLATPLAATSWYWLKINLLPYQIPGADAGGLLGGGHAPPLVYITLLADSAGSPGAALMTGAGVQAFDALTAMVGRPQIGTSGAPVIVGWGGGLAPSPHTVSLFGPGGWLFNGLAGSASAVSSGAWDQLVANTYPSGPVTSYGAARIDLAPAGTVDAYWHVYGSGPAAGTPAMAIQTPGNVVYAQCVVKSSGLGNGATVALKYSEFNSSGTFLRSGTLQTLTISGGVQIAWPAAGTYSLTGNWTTGANCAYVDIQIEVADTVAGNSANGTVWIDNTMVWDATRTGMTTMPYCELTFPNTPSALVVSGVLGHVPAPTVTSIALYLATWNGGQSGTVYLARRLAASSRFTFASPSAGTTTSALDGTAYGGYAAPNVDGGPYWISDRIETGVFRLIERIKTSTTPATGVYLQTDLVIYTGGGLFDVGRFRGLQVYPFSATNTWTIADVGQVTLPLFPVGNFNTGTGFTQLVSVVSNVGTLTANWVALMPADAETLIFRCTNPQTSQSQAWLLIYQDGNWPATTLAMQTVSTPNIGVSNPQPAGASYLGGTEYGVSNVADQVLYLDPRLTVNGVAGVNSLGLVADDNNAVAWPCAVEITYAPQYLYPM